MYEVHVDDETMRVMTTWGKRVTGASLLDYQRTVWNEPKVAGYDELIDFRLLEEVDVSTDDLRSVAKLAARMDIDQGQSRFAIVVSGTLTFGLSRMYQILRDVEDISTRDVKVFQALDDAVAWLDEDR